MDPPRPDTSERQLSASEFTVLQQMLVLVRAIVTDDALVKLASLGVLGEDFPSGQADVFIGRFRKVADRFEELMKETGAVFKTRKVQVSGQLPAGQSAHTSTDTKHMDDTETVLRLAPAALLGGQQEQDLLKHVLIMIHELTHALEPDAGFPVKDFAYMEGWAYGFLPPACVIRNADSYRHLAALIAGKRAGVPSRYMPSGSVPRQRDVLKKSPLVNLSNALALANLVLDRAWIRSGDCQRFGRASIDSAAWGDLANPETRRPDDAQLRRFEDWLCSKEIIEGREFGFFGVNLSSDDQDTINIINKFLKWTKDILNKMIVVLSDSGDMSYKGDTCQLFIPYQDLGMNTRQLAKKILGVVSCQAPGQKEAAGDSKKQKSRDNTISNRVDLIFELSLCDRPDTRQQVNDCCLQLTRDMHQVLPSSVQLAEINAALNPAAR